MVAGFKLLKLVIFNFCAQIMPRRFLIDTMYVHMYPVYVTGPAKIDHVSAKKSPIFSVFAVS